MSQKYTQKYTIVCFFDSRNAPTNFHASDWPLHVTMLDTFKTDWKPGTLFQNLIELTQATTPFNVNPTKQTMLGPARDVPVKLLSLDNDILELHNRLMNLAEEGSFVFNTPELVGEGFLPHATDQKNSKVEIGQTYRLTDVSLVDMFPDGDHMRRKTIDTFTLGR